MINFEKIDKIKWESKDIKNLSYYDDNKIYTYDRSIPYNFGINKHKILEYKVFYVNNAIIFNSSEIANGPEMFIKEDN